MFELITIIALICGPQSGALGGINMSATTCQKFHYECVKEKQKRAEWYWPMGESKALEKCVKIIYKQIEQP